MSYITKQELEDFIGKFPEEPEQGATDIVAQYCTSAEEMIAKYLGYNPELTSYTTTRYGDDGKIFELEAFPLVTLTSAASNGNALDVSGFRVMTKNYLEYNYGRGIFSKDNLYSFQYTAGFSEVPRIIKTTALQIASLLWESAGGNLAVSSTSFADSGSRVFNNFKADRFLEQINEYRIGLQGGF